MEFLRGKVAVAPHSKNWRKSASCHCSSSSVAFCVIRGECRARDRPQISLFFIKLVAWNSMRMLRLKHEMMDDDEKGYLSLFNAFFVAGFIGHTACTHVVVPRHTHTHTLSFQIWPKTLSIRSFLHATWLFSTISIWGPRLFPRTAQVMVIHLFSSNHRSPTPNLTYQAVKERIELNAWLVPYFY